MVRRVLMIAYHYPPAGISSGIQRTLKFSTYLQEHGWSPAVLSAAPRAYERLDESQLAEIPADVVVKRAFALDAARHLAIAGRYPLLAAVPDRWSSWLLGGLVSGLRMIRRLRPQVLWSTYPIATAHLIGLTLQRLTGLPWIADCRDSMTEEGYPRDPTVRRSYLWIERKTVERAARVVFTTPGTLRMYARRYPEVPAERWSEIPNGYDEENFVAAEGGVESVDGRRPLLLVHSGVIYPSERDPSAFFAALAELKRAGVVSAETLRICLRASGHDEIFRPMLAERGIADLVALEPPLAYRHALSEMLQADGLLLFQASNCNHQIPAKLYEYFRARRPILALTDPFGDTAHALLSAGVTTIVRLDDASDIERGLREFLQALRAGTAPVASESAIAEASRRARSRDLARLLDRVVGAQAGGSAS